MVYLSTPAACEGGCLLHLGGLPKQCLGALDRDSHLSAHVYQLSINQWTRLELVSASANGSLPLARDYFGAAACNQLNGTEVVMIAGGRTLGTGLQDTWQLTLHLDAKSLIAQPLADMPNPRVSLALAMQPESGRMFLTGGSSDKTGLHLQDDVWTYSIAHDKWNTAGKLPQPRAHHTAVVANGELLLWAGSLDQVLHSAVHFACTIAVVVDLVSAVCAVNGCYHSLPHCWSNCPTRQVVPSLETNSCTCRGCRQAPLFVLITRSCR
jgi:hypothetical protein